jgi:hypothetical protein
MLSESSVVLLSDTIATWDRARVWEQLSALNPIPHFSQFVFSQGQEIPNTMRILPPGEITVIRIRFPVTWRIETFSDLIIQQDLSAGFTADDAWTRLHIQLFRSTPTRTHDHGRSFQRRSCDLSEF